MHLTKNFPFIYQKMTKFSEENPIAQFAVTTPGKHLSKCGAK
jgi:hypothetical protein